MTKSERLKKERVFFFWSPSANSGQTEVKSVSSCRERVKRVGAEAREPIAQRDGRLCRGSNGALLLLGMCGEMLSESIRGWCVRTAEASKKATQYRKNPGILLGWAGECWI